MKMKRFLAALLALCLLLSHAPAGAFAAETVASGTCGDTATWSLENGVLTISGTGMMANYDLETAAPWSDYAESIISVVVEDGVSFVGSYAFAELPNLVEATIADSVTFILEGAFFYCPALETVKLSAELGFIGDVAFRYCKSLKDLEIPDSVGSIGKYAFHACHAFTYLKLPECMPEIPEGMAASCSNLTGVYIPDSVDKIGDSAFMDCASLEAVEIPAGVTSMESLAFANCSGLTEITFWGDAPAMDDTESLFAGATATVYYPADNATWTEDVKLNYGGTLTWVPNTLVAAGTCGDNLTWTLDTDGLLTVSGQGAMTEHPWTEQHTASITSAVIEEGVTSICGLSFEGCTNLTSVTVPSTVTDMGLNTFNGCRSLVSVNIPAGVTTLGQGIFMECDSLTSIVIPDSVTEINERAFCYSGLESVEIPAGVTAIGETAFYGCDALDEIVFLGDAPEFGANVFTYVSAMAYYPMGNTTWTEDVMQDYGGSLTWACRDAAGNLYGNNADDTTWVLSGDTLTISGTGMLSDFAFRAAKHLVIEEGITGIDICVFMADDWETVELASSVTVIGGEAFLYNEYLTSVTICGNGLATVDERAFYGCAALPSLVLPASVTTVGAEAFGECESLTAVTFTGDAPTIGTDAFYGVTATVCYPAGNTTWTEDVMQDYGGNLTWIAYGGETEALFALSGTSVSLCDSLDMHFVIDPANVAEGYYAVLTRYYADGRDDHVITVPFSAWRALSDGSLYVTYSGIAAKEMGDYVEVTVYNGNGEAVSEVYADSVKSYAMRMLGKEEVTANEELRTLYVDMLNYGAAAQAQFGYNVTMPANDLLTEEQQAYATVSYVTEDDLVKGTGRAGTTLTLKNRMTLDMIFTNSAIGSDYTGLYAVVTYFNHYDDEVKIRINDIKAYGSNYGYVSVPSLVVADYCQPVTVTVYNAQGDVLAWATDSIEGYAHRMKGSLPEMVEAIVKFGTSAYNYFH